MAKKHQNGEDHGSPRDRESQHESAPEGVDEQTGEIHDALESMTQEQIELPSKLVAKNIVARKDMLYKKDDEGNVLNPEPRGLYRVFGIVGGTMTGESTYGPWTAFTGDFEAIRFVDGRRFRSNKLFLQNPAEGLLVGALSAAKVSDPSATVEFAFDIGVKPSARWVDTGQGNSYEYTCASQIQTNKNDPLKQLRQMATRNMPRLSGPNA